MTSNKEVLNMIDWTSNKDLLNRIEDVETQMKLMRDEMRKITSFRVKDLSLLERLDGIAYELEYYEDFTAHDQGLRALRELEHIIEFVRRNRQWKRSRQENSHENKKT